MKLSQKQKLFQPIEKFCFNRKPENISQCKPRNVFLNWTILKLLNNQKLINLIFTIL